jgi:hypothetical protein
MSLSVLLSPLPPPPHSFSRPRPQPSGSSSPSSSSLLSLSMLARLKKEGERGGKGVTLVCVYARACTRARVHAHRSILPMRREGGRGAGASRGRWRLLNPWFVAPPLHSFQVLLLRVQCVILLLHWQEGDKRSAAAAAKTALGLGKRVATFLPDRR